MRRVFARAVAPGDADCAAVLDIDPLHRGAQFHRQPAVGLERLDIRIGGAAAFPAPVHELVEPDPALRRPVEVVGERLAHLLNRLDEPARHVVDMPGVRHQQRPVDAVKIVLQAVVALDALEVAEHRRPVPRRAVIVAAQDLVPLVVVAGPAAHVDLGVDRRTAAQDVPLRDIVYPAVEMRLRHRVVVRHVLAAVDQLEDPRRHVEQRMMVRVARFEQQHPPVAVCD